MASFEILEHTADVGIRALGKSQAEVFEQATLAMCDISGVWRPGPGKRRVVRVESGDPGGLLVAWLSEILYLHDANDALVAGLELEEVTTTSASGTVKLAARGDAAVEGTQIKAITYHRLRVEPADSGWIAEVYVDV